MPCETFSSLILIIIQDSNIKADLFNANEALLSINYPEASDVNRDCLNIKDLNIKEAMQLRTFFMIHSHESSNIIEVCKIEQNQCIKYNCHNAIKMIP